MGTKVEKLAEMIDNLTPASGKMLYVPLSQTAYDSLRKMFDDEQERVIKKLTEAFDDASGSEEAIQLLK